MELIHDNEKHRKYLVIAVNAFLSIYSLDELEKKNCGLKKDSVAEMDQQILIYKIKVSQTPAGF